MPFSGSADGAVQYTYIYTTACSSHPHAAHTLSTTRCTYTLNHTLHIHSYPHAAHTLSPTRCTYTLNHTLHIHSQPHAAHTLSTTRCTYKTNCCTHIFTTPNSSFAIKIGNNWCNFITFVDGVGGASIYKTIRYDIRHITQGGSADWKELNIEGRQFCNT